MRKIKWACYLPRLLWRFIPTLVRRNICKIFDKIFYKTKEWYLNTRHFFRIQKPIVKLLGYEWKFNQEFIDIFVTYDCNIRCFNCNVKCRQAPSADAMSVGQIKKFINESIKNKKRWRRITIIGGEPSLHPDILEISRLLAEYKQFSSNEVKLIFSTNGYGEKTNAILSKLPQEFAIRNSKKISPQQKDFVCFDNAPIDHKNYKHVEYKGGCQRILSGGLSLNKYGYYPCCAAGAIDRVLGFDLGLKNFPNKCELEMRKRLEVFCKYCGAFLYSDYKKPFGYASPMWVEFFEKYKKNKPQLSLF